MSAAPWIIQGYDIEAYDDPAIIAEYFDPSVDNLWVRHDDHLAEVERLQAVRRALVRDNRDKTNTIRQLEAALRPIIEDDLGALPKAVLDRAAAALAAVSAEKGDTR